MQLDSYMGYMEDEDIAIQLPFIVTHEAQNKIEFSSVTILSEGINIAEEISAQMLGSSETDYSLYTLVVSLNFPSPGIYSFDNVTLTTAANEKHTYNIGNWTIEIKKGSNPPDIDLQQACTMLGVFERYTIEIKNLSHNTINIENIYALLEKHSVSTTIFSGSDYDAAVGNQSNDLSLKSGATKGFSFEFDVISVPQDSKNSFVCLKPFLVYEINNQKKYMSLPETNYSPSFG